MKRIALAAALAGAVAAPAFAQSSVTIYGRLNTTIENWKAGGAKSVTSMENNASRLGFKGTEDLGGGLKANFLIEHRFASDTGVASSEFWSGDAWVGLSGDFGQVRLGRMTSAAYFATADYVSMHNHDTGSSADALYSLGFQSWVTKNKISYTTPDIGGLTVELQYALKEDQSVIGKNAIDLAANYQAGPLHLGAGYTKLGDDQQIAFRALYEMGAFTFGGYYQRTKLDDSFGGDGKANVFRLSAMYTVGASEFHANLGYAGDVGDIDDSGATQFTLGYNYNLSKRTKVYAFYTKISADNANPYVGDFRSVGLGIRHNF
jgi:predicted porin